jgi:predicted phosphodiesterase
MLLALLSDIHANLPALQACLAEAERRGAERYIVMGDLVGYGPDPQEVMETLLRLPADKTSFIKGNHDEAIELASPHMNETARRAIDWTRPRLSDAARRFLKELPFTLKLDDDLFVHADASAPQQWKYVNGPEEARASLNAGNAPATFCGHVHIPALYCVSATAKLVSHLPGTEQPLPLASHRRWLAVVGSVGQPRDGNPAAAFCTFETTTRQLVYHRAPYDAEGVANRIRKHGLPDSLAARLLSGL